MSSIFDLKTDASELAYSSSADLQGVYRQVQAQRAIGPTTLSDGQISYKFELSGQEWFVPSKSYLRIRSKLTRADNTSLQMADEIAPSQDIGSSLFQNAEFRISNNIVSKCSEFMSEVSALNNRTSKSKAWMDSVGDSGNFWGSYEQRKARVCNDSHLVSSTSSANLIETKAQLGFDALNTYAYTSATGALVFAAGGGAAPPDVRVVFPIGSHFAIGTKQYEVVDHVDALTVLLNIAVSADIPAAATTFNRVLRRAETNDAHGSFETIYQPPISVFSVDHAMPAGSYDLTLNPHTASTINKRVVETLSEKVAGTDYLYSVDTIYLYIYVIKGPRVSDSTYLLDLEQTTCQSDSTLSANFQQKIFETSPSTNKLVVAWQSANVDTSTVYSPSKFVAPGNCQHQLTRLSISYDGQTKPSPEADISYNVNTPEHKDWLVQRYMDGLLDSGLYWSEGGAENISQWRDRGLFHLFKWQKEGSSASRRVQVNTQFDSSAAANLALSRMLLFSTARSVAIVTVKDSRVYTVEVQDV